MKSISHSLVRLRILSFFDVYFPSQRLHQQSVLSTLPLNNPCQRLNALIIS